MMNLSSAARSVAALLTVLFISFSCQQKQSSNDTFEYVSEHEKDDSDPSTDFAGSLEYEFSILKDPATGIIPEGVFEAEMEQARQILSNQLMSTARILVNNYSFQGPNNLGGRTRALAYDVRFNGTSNQVILAGGVSGGVYKSTNDGASWTRKSPTDQHYSVTSLAQDPRPGFQDTWYYTTGEASGNSAAGVGAIYAGNGVYKSTDNGETWTRLTNSNPSTLEVFNSAADFINKVVVNPANGDVYVACMATILRSQNGGANWTSVLSGTLGNNSQHTDIVINSTGTRMYASFSGTNTNTVDGVWNSADGTTWTRIAGAGAGGSPVGWNADAPSAVPATAGAYGRVVLALAPSNENILYALYWNNVTSNCTTPAIESELFRWTFTGPLDSDGSWTDLSSNLPDEAGCSAGNDPFGVQSGYDLLVAVKPDNANVVFVGGTNLYRSTDGFTTNTTTTRIGGYANTAGYTLYANSHSDIHALAFEPGSPAEMMCGNDGGIQKTTNNLAPTVAWSQTNTGFRTFQYYHVTLDPRSGNDKVFGGAQDNGTTRNVGGTGTNFELVRSGDGVSVGLSNEIGGAFFEYVGVQNGAINRRNATSLPDFVTSIRPSLATPNGLFVTLFKLDPDNTETIYYANNDDLWRNTSASTANTTNWTELTGIGTAVIAAGATQISALTTTRGTYNIPTSSLFIGTNSGDVFRLDNPANSAAATAPVNITGAAFPASGNVSSIAVNPRNDDTVLVTFSNYGVTSIFWTGNANAATPTWVNVEDELLLPSVRSSAIAVTNTGVQYFVGTSVGLYTAQIDAANPGNINWAQEGPSDIGNAVVSSLALRTTDNKLLVGTHGYGMWTTTLTLFGLPVTLTSFEGKAATKSNSLYWSVENERSNKGFELQRSYGATATFETIGFVSAKENPTGKNSYTMEDKLVDLGKPGAFYRLKQIDKDGQTTYSKTIVLNRAVATKFVEYISASTNNLLIRINNGSVGTRMKVRILDASGKEVQRNDLVYQTQNVDISRLPSGVYATEITNNRNERWVGKFAK